MAVGKRCANCRARIRRGRWCLDCIRMAVKTLATTFIGAAVVGFAERFVTWLFP